MKVFYSHLIEIESIVVELDKMNLSSEEKKHLAKLVDSSLHHTILDAVFSELSESDKKAFLNHLNENDHQKIWDFLNSKVDKVEDKIKKVSEDLKLELHKDLKEADKQ